LSTHYSELERSSILAHRGYWHNTLEHNSIISLTRALEYGFGIETDIRDLDGTLVLSHDPPRHYTNPLKLEWLLRQIVLKESQSRLALNIKSDGLEPLITDILKSFNLDSNNVYVFDMSIPDSISYVESETQVYLRISEFESLTPLLNKASGIWLDCFDGESSQAEMAKSLLSSGIRTAVVSSELHKRDHEPLWKSILDLELHHSPLFELCTDFPEEAFRTFCLL